MTIKSKTAKAVEEATTTSEPGAKKKLFGVVGKVIAATSGPELDNLKIEDGSNKFRILTPPLMVRKHWDVPESAEVKTVPCLKHVEDPEAYAADPQGYLDSLADCPFCEWEAAHGGKGGFYNARDSWVMNVVVEDDPKTGEGGRVLVAEFGQKSIMKALGAFEEDTDWADLMNENGVIGFQINLKKTSTGPKPQNVKYEVGGVPTSKPLTTEQINAYLDDAVDLPALKALPVAGTPEGDDKIRELLKKAGEPRAGEKPKKL